MLSLKVSPFSSVAVKVNDPAALDPERFMFTLKFPFPLDADKAALLLPELARERDMLPSPAIATDIGVTTPFIL
jgi:hypothetical protein